MKSLLSGVVAVLLIGVLSMVPERAAAANPLVTELEAQLSKSTTPADSLNVLFDLFDASAYKDRAVIGWKILDIAVRTNNQEVLIDFIPQVAGLEVKQDEKLRDLLVVCNRVEDAEHRKGIKLFVNINRVINEATYLSDADRKRALVKYAQADMSKYNDLYDEILDLARVVTFVGMSSQSNMYLEYLTRLENLVEELPEERYYIRNVFYTRAANAHTAFGNHEKAIETDRKLLKVIEDLESKYKKLGRKYRNYDRYKYISYRRMLRNYEGLSLQEVKDIYDKCATLAENNEEVMNDFSNIGRPYIYLLMAEKQYKEVIPRIKKVIPYETDRNVIRELQRMLVTASDAVGDHATLLTALKEYNKLLQETVDRRSEEAYRELQVRYDVNMLEKENSELERAKNETEVATGQKLVSISLAALLLLAVIIMVLYRSHFSLRQKAHALKRENEKLHGRIEEILNDGIPSGTHDVHGMTYDNPDEGSPI